MKNKTSHNNLINGIASDYLNVDDRSIHYGDGLFETILCSNNKLYYWQQHLLRLQKSAQRLKIACPQEQLLLDDITKLLAENKHQSDCAIKIIVSRGSGQRGYKFSENAAANRMVFLSALATAHSSLLSKELLSGDLYLCQQQVSINKNLAGLKHLNRLENVLARDEWKNDYIDGLMLNANQHVIEGSMSNLFAVKGRQLFTPDLALSGVNGIMREVVMDLANKNNLDVVVNNIDIKQLFAMDELFITNSLIGIKSVTKIADVTYNQQHVTNMIFNDLLTTKENYVQVV